MASKSANPDGIETLTINDFTGRLTRLNFGDINSGYAKYPTTYGNDPFTNPSNLAWFEKPVRIDSGATVITDLIMAARPRLENGITYVYAIGHTGRLYKIQVNDPTTYNPNYDNPVLLTVLTINSPTFKYGSSIQYFGATEKIYIGHDKGVTSVNFDGTGEAFVGDVMQWIQNVPRPSANFTGITFWGNGTNIAAIDSTATVSTYAKLSPGFPVGTQTRDIDVSPDGNYLQVVVSRLPQPDMTVTTQDTTSLSSSDSYLIYWNGSDIGYTAYNPYNSYSLNSNTSFGTNNYTFGYDLGGGAIYSGGTKLVTLTNSTSPNFGAVYSSGNMVGFASPEHTDNGLEGSILTYGQYDEENKKGLYRHLRFVPDIDGVPFQALQMPMCTIVTDLFYGSSFSGYVNNQVGSAKLYFSALIEENNGEETDYGLYRFSTFPTGTNDAIQGVYETQTQLFSKKITLKGIRFYFTPLVDNNSFKVELIGSSGDPILNSSKTFTAGTGDNAVGNDWAWWTPQIAPTYALGLRITNLGTANMAFAKIEIDYTIGGQ